MYVKGYSRAVLYLYFALGGLTASLVLTASPFEASQSDNDNWTPVYKAVQLNNPSHILLTNSWDELSNAVQKFNYGSYGHSFYARKTAIPGKTVVVKRFFLEDNARLGSGRGFYYTSDSAEIANLTSAPWSLSSSSEFILFSPLLPQPPGTLPLYRYVNSSKVQIISTIKSSHIDAQNLRLLGYAPSHLYRGVNMVVSNTSQNSDTNDSVSSSDTPSWKPNLIRWPLSTFTVVHATTLPSKAAPTDSESMHLSFSQWLFKNAVFSGGDANEREADTANDWNDYAYWLDSAMANLDNFLSNAPSGVTVLVDLHIAPWGCSPSNRTVFASPLNVFQNPNLFENPLCQDLFKNAWAYLSLRYGQNPKVWGFDVLNEPWVASVGASNWNSAAALWNSLAETSAKIIQSNAAADKRIVIESPYGDPKTILTIKPVTGVANAVYSFHMYWPTDFTYQGISTSVCPCTPKSADDKSCADSAKVLPSVFPSASMSSIIPDYASPSSKPVYGSWDVAGLQQAIRPVVLFQQQYHVPIYVGEFSASRWTSPGSAANFLDACINLFESHGWDWTYFSDIQNTTDATSGSAFNVTLPEGAQYDYFCPSRPSDSLQSSTSTSRMQVLMKAFDGNLTTP